MIVLADGIYSTVYAEDNSVYKKYKLDSVYLQAASEMFACEIEIMEALKDLPYVPVVLDHSRKFCKMTLMPGSTLDDCNIYLLKDNAQNILDALESFAWLVYDRGYLINDVHLGNILIDYKRGISFIDFNSYISVDNQAEVISLHHSFKHYEEGYSGTRRAAEEFIKLQLCYVKTQILNRLKERGMHVELFFEWEAG